MAKYKILSVKNKSLIYTVRGNKVYREDSDSLAYTIDGDRIYHGTKTFFEQPLYIINGNEIYANDNKRKPEFIISGDYILDGQKGRKVYKVVRDYSLSFGFFKSNSSVDEERQPVRQEYQPVNNRANTRVNARPNTRPNKNTSSSIGELFAVVLGILGFILMWGVWGTFMSGGDTTQNQSAQNDANYEEDKTEKEEPEEIKSVLSITDEQKVEFIFWDSDVRYLSDEEASNLEPLLLQAAINEIYARHGRMWKDENWNNYFMSKTWYVPQYSADEFSTDVFNKVEKANIDTLVKYR